ncbi:MAG: hypothetical protein WAN86_08405 [Hyphomicrobiaceae bacterium]
MRRRPPYLEIALTVAVLVFVALVVAGGFGRPADNIAQATSGPE